MNINGNRYRLTLLAASLALTSIQAQAGAGLEGVKWSGFMNAIGAVSDSNRKYLEDIDKDGSFDETSFGLVASAQLNQRLRVAGQIFLSTEEVNFDWGFANYVFNENITGQAGKMKYAGNLVSEYIDVGLAYPWVRAPESVYSDQAELSFEAYSGLGGIYQGGDDLTYSLNLYGGEIKSAGENNEEFDRLIGAVLTLENDYGEFKLNANQSKISNENLPVDGEDRTLLSAGVRGDWNNFVLYGEFAHSEIDNFSNADINAWYTTLGYRFGKTMPHITYQDYDADSGEEQTSWTLGVKQTLTPSSALKLEVQRVSDIENGGLFDQQPDDSDVYLFNAALNFVF